MHTEVPTILELKKVPKGSGCSIEVGPPGNVRRLPLSATSADVQAAILKVQASEKKRGRAIDRVNEREFVCVCAFECPTL